VIPGDKETGAVLKTWAPWVKTVTLLMVDLTGFSVVAKRVRAGKMRQAIRRCRFIF
jgi:hypothetical protein